jgi:hypothetical protein
MPGQTAPKFQTGAPWTSGASDSIAVVSNKRSGLWRKKGCPKGILVEKRDQLISEYQRDHGLLVSSIKTNQRFFKR